MRSPAALVLLVTSGGGAWGQAPITRSADLFPDVKATVEYGYRLVEGDTVLHGGWRAWSTERDSADPASVQGLELEGRFDQGLKSGPWTYSAKRLRTEEAPMVQGFHVVRSTSGTDHRIEASFSQGKAHGPWTMVEQRIARSRPLDTLVMVSATFAHGHLAGDVEGAQGAARFRAAFEREGLAHGTWSHAHPVAGGSIVEQRIFEAGLLRAHHFEHRGERRSVTYTGMDLAVAAGDPALVPVPLDRDLLRLLTLASRPHGASDMEGMPTDSLSDRSGSMLMEAIDALSRHEERSVWQAAPGSEMPSPAMLKLKEHPFSPEELRARTRTMALHREAELLLARFFSDPLSDLGRHAFEDIAACHAIMEVYADRLEALGAALAVVEHPLARLVDRSVLLPALTPPIEYPTAVAYVFKERSLERPHSFPPTLWPEGSTVQALEAHLDAVLKDLRHASAKAETILDRYRAQNQLVDKEQRLVAERDSIVRLFRNEAHREDHNDLHAAVAPAVEELVTGRFKQYAAAGLDEKVDRIDMLLACYRDVLDLYTHITRIPLRMQRIEEAYTRSVWNPYTYTFMDERVKDRLYRTYETVVLPHMRNELLNSISCERLPEATSGFAEIYRLMLDLREQDTKDLERELRRVTDATEALALLQAAAPPIPRSE